MSYHKEELNRNFVRRDALLGLPDGKYDIHRISGNLNLLEVLLKENFIDPEEQQNDAPQVQEFYRFLQKYPNINWHGYAVTPTRSDYRVSIEGLEYKGPISFELARDFTQLCRHADEFDLTENHLYCWFD